MFKDVLLLKFKVDIHHKGELGHTKFGEINSATL